MLLVEQLAEDPRPEHDMAIEVENSAAHRAEWFGGFRVHQVPWAPILAVQFEKSCRNGVREVPRPSST